MQDPELVNQLKERLPEALFEKLSGSLSIDRDRLRFAEYKVRVLEERLRLVRIEKYGRDRSRRTRFRCYRSRNAADVFHRREIQSVRNPSH
jgi:hypothetical protein